MTNMRIIILSDDTPTYLKPMALSLNKMFTRLGINSEICYEGTRILNIRNHYKPIEIIKNFKRKFINFFIKAKYKNHIHPTLQEFTSLCEKIKTFDAVFVCAHMPYNLSNNFYQGIDLLRKKIKIPIIDYELCFLWSTKPRWYKEVIEHGGFSGFGRFDHYVLISQMSNLPIKENSNWPLTVIGGDFRDEELFPDQTDFRALIDFDKKINFEERKIQIKVLEELKIPYTILSGTYTHSELYRVFRKHSIYFLSMSENFGLPIVELQNCGCKVFIPHKYWAAAHYINKDPYKKGDGDLNNNFVVYSNNPQILKEKILNLKEKFSAKKVIEEFSNKNLDFYSGNLLNLKKVLKKIKSNEINSMSGSNYKELEKEITLNMRQDVSRYK
tara:strand:+ start:1205 stop:2359 length:1155 start_codon:yes stop_codon:yes gene_type:complete